MTFESVVLTQSQNMHKHLIIAAKLLNSTWYIRRGKVTKMDF